MRLCTISDLTKKELINLIDETFNEYVKEGASKVNAANNVLFDIAKNLANNDTNQLITYSHFLTLLKGSEETDSYKRYKEFVDILENKQ